MDVSYLSWKPTQAARVRLLELFQSYIMVTVDLRGPAVPMMSQILVPQALAYDEKLPVETRNQNSVHFAFTSIPAALTIMVSEAERDEVAQEVRFYSIQ